MIVWPDRNAPGEAAARTVAAELRRLGVEPTVVDVEALGLPEGGDAGDLTELPGGELPLLVGDVPDRDRLSGHREGSPQRCAPPTASDSVVRTVRIGGLVLVLLP